MTMSFDPTTNRIPFELLTEDERAALKAWPHGWTYFTVSGWKLVVTPSWGGSVVYRGFPAPMVTSKWFNVYPDEIVHNAHTTREKADRAADDDARIAIMRIETCNGVSTAHLEDV
jgi:hypothetical protein